MEIECTGLAPDICSVHGSLYEHHPRCDYTAATEHVYAIAEVGSDYVKIGRSRDPVYRLGELQTGNPRRLELIGCSELLTYAPSLERGLREILVSNGATPAPGGSEWVEIGESGLRASMMLALTDVSSWQAIELRETTMPNPAPVWIRQ